MAARARPSALNNPDAPPPVPTEEEDPIAAVDADEVDSEGQKVHGDSGAADLDSSAVGGLGELVMMMVPPLAIMVGVFIYAIKHGLY